MRFFMALFLALNCCVSSVWAQTVNNEAKHQQRVAEMENNSVVKYSRSILPTNKDQKTARNLMIVKEVVNFKMGDENLAKYYDNLDDNKRYNKDMDKIFSKLSNSKRSNTKNKKVIEILNDAGERIYNLMSN